MGNALWLPDLPPKKAQFEPKFDPMLGFPNGRKERTIKATLQEMESAGIPPEQRDYCVDVLIKFLACRRDHFPFVYKCKHEVHDYHQCQFNDHELRMKEYEREKRLMKRASKQTAESMKE